MTGMNQDTMRELAQARRQLDAIREHLSPFILGDDPAGMTEVELAESAAAAIRDGMDRIFSRSSDNELENACAGGCTPDMETVPLQALIEAMSLFLDDGQSITVHPGQAITVNALGRQFVGSPAHANELIDASATLLRMEVV